MVMRNDYSRERRRWDAISSRQRVADVGHIDYEDMGLGLVVFDEEWPGEKLAPRRVDKVECESTARTGKARRREQKRQREQERANERRIQQVREQELGWGGW
ncbi:hypothetical protein N5B55_04730 [Ralstonia pickettii]|uniref:hypothetical protein n=1 Tax=Ralstonia pickettii TaxID=329 RepID=UPI0027153DB6|nr:hypothetical protein [Ralstonia pickettii]WKZ86258.1 hypothetical protein N5B55_04730 [Ralstonia pickettii]